MIGESGRFLNCRERLHEQRILRDGDSSDREIFNGAQGLDTIINGRGNIAFTEQILFATLFTGLIFLADASATGCAAESVCNGLCSTGHEARVELRSFMCDACNSVTRNLDRFGRFDDKARCGMGVVIEEPALAERGAGPEDEDNAGPAARSFAQLDASGNDEPPEPAGLRLVKDEGAGLIAGHAREGRDVLELIGGDLPEEGLCTKGAKNESIHNPRAQVAEDGARSNDGVMGWRREPGAGLET